MNKQKLLSELAKFLDIDMDDLSDEYDIKGHGLDSLMVVSMIAAIDIIYSIRVQGCEIDKCESVGDIFILIESKQKKHEYNNK